MINPSPATRKRKSLDEITSFPITNLFGGDDDDSPNEDTSISDYSEWSLNTVNRSQHNPHADEDESFILCSPTDVLGPLDEACPNEASLQPRIERWQGNPYLSGLLRKTSDDVELARITAIGVSSSSSVTASMRNKTSNNSRRKYHRIDEKVLSTDESPPSFSKVSRGGGSLHDFSAFQMKLRSNMLSNQPNKNREETLAPVVHWPGESNAKVGLDIEASRNNEGISRQEKVFESYGSHELKNNGMLSPMKQETRNFSLSSSLVYASPSVLSTKVNDNLISPPAPPSPSSCQYDYLSPPLSLAKLALVLCEPMMVADQYTGGGRYSMRRAGIRLNS